eukprot:Selendium_serpulae@DN5168_c0_g1_i1.p1
MNENAKQQQALANGGGLGTMGIPGVTPTVPIPGYDGSSELTPEQELVAQQNLQKQMQERYSNLSPQEREAVEKEISQLPPDISQTVQQSLQEIATTGTLSPALSRKLAQQLSATQANTAVQQQSATQTDSYAPAAF